MLRFGIELMQPGLLIEQALGPTGHPAELGQRGFSVDVACAVERVASLGFSLIELNPDLMVFFPQCLNLPSVERLRALKESRNLTYTVHLPLWSVEPSTPVESVRRGSVDALVEGVLRMAPLEPEVYVLHATGALAAEFGRMAALEPVRPLVMRLFQEQARRSVKTLLDCTGLPSRLVALETIEFPFELMLELAEEFDLSVCLDTGHVLAGYSGDVTVAEALQRTFPCLAEVHLHDGYRRSAPGGPVRVADHLPLGEGDLAVEWFLEELDQRGFVGPVVFELTIEEAQTSLEVIQARCPDLLPPRGSVRRNRGRNMNSVTFLGQEITRQQVIDALNQFDSQYPNTNDYDSWLDKGMYRYAVRYGGNLYPCKFVLSLASGFDVSDFGGGEQTNRVFGRLGFEVISKP